MSHATSTVEGINGTRHVVRTQQVTWGTAIDGEGYETFTLRKPSTQHPRQDWEEQGDILYAGGAIEASQNHMLAIERAKKL